MTAVAWVVGGCLAAVGIYMRGWTRGRRHGIAEAGAWEALADQLDDALREAEESLARADATIDMLRRNDDLAFLAGQQMRREREEWGLT